MPSVWLEMDAGIGDFRHRHITLRRFGPAAVSHERSRLLSADPFAVRHSCCLNSTARSSQSPSGQSTSTVRISSRSRIFEGEHLGFPVVGGLEPFGGVVEAGVAELRGER